LIQKFAGVDSIVANSYFTEFCGDFCNNVGPFATSRNVRPMSVIGASRTRFARPEPFPNSDIAGEFLL
jgi:hypothetical protein